MRRHLSASDLFSELKMIRTAFGGTLLLVEGPTDHLILSGFVRHDCRVIVGHGRDLIIGVIKLVDQQKMKGVLALADADFDRLDGNLLSSSNIVYTEFHDFEMHILQSTGFQRVARNLCDDAKVTAFLAHHAASSLAEALLMCTSFVGHCRWLAMRTGQRLKFRGVDTRDHLDRSTCAIDEDSFVRDLLRNSPRATCTEGWVKAGASNLMGAKKSLLDVCRGHDVTDVLGFALLEAIGNCSREISSRRNIEMMFRISFGDADFNRTSVANEFREWTKRNSPYGVL